MDEPLYQPLLVFRFDAEQLASFQSAGPAGILEGQPASAVMDVGHLVARAFYPTPADLLTCGQESASGKPKENPGASRKGSWRLVSLSVIRLFLLFIFGFLSPSEKTFLIENITKHFPAGLGFYRNKLKAMCVHAPPHTHTNTI